MKKYLYLFFPLFLFIFIATNTKVNAATITLQAIADTQIDQQHPDAHYGSAWHSVIRNESSKYSCYLGRFEEANLPPEVIIDNATFKFYLFRYMAGSNIVLQVGANGPTPQVTDEFPHNTISWSNSPERITDFHYTSYKHINVDHTGVKQIDITKLYKAWQTGEIENNGLYLCVAPSQPRTEFDIYTREKNDLENAQPIIVLSYHTASLGDPAYDPGTDSDMSFELLTPDGDTLSNPPYTFTWENPAGSDPAREHLTIILNKVNSDGSRTQIFKQEIPITWTRFESSIPLEDGNYEWYIEAYLMDHKLFTAEKKTFTVNHNSPAESSTEETEGNDESGEEPQTEETSSNQTESNTSEEQDNPRDNNQDKQQPKAWKILGFSISVSKEDIIWSILAISILANVGLAYYLFGKKKDTNKKDVASQDKGSSDIKVKTKEEKKTS